MRAKLLAVSLGVVVLAAPACGRDESIAMAPAAATDAGVDAQVKPVPDAGPRVRRVEARNPFGNTTQADNLLVDGDFEWTSGTGQYGWRALKGLGEASLERETGGLCRSGVTCGKLAAGVSFLGFAAAAPSKEMEVRVWTKPPAPDCLLTVVNVLQCTTYTVDVVATILHESEFPDERGWCVHSGVVPAMDLQPCLYVQTYVQDSGVTLVDDATLLPAEKPTRRKAWMRAPGAKEKAEFEAALRTLARPWALGTGGPQVRSSANNR